MLDFGQVSELCRDKVPLDTRSHSLPVYLESKQSLTIIHFIINLDNLRLHPWRLTWNIIMEVWKIIFLSKRVICRCHANLPGCNQQRLWPWIALWTCWCQKTLAGEAPKTKGPWGTPNWNHHSCHPGPERIAAAKWGSKMLEILEHPVKKQGIVGNGFYQFI